MLIRVAMVGKAGRKWHIAFNELLTYCKAKPSWIDNEDKEMSEIDYLCASCRSRYANLSKPAHNLIRR